MTPTIWRLKGEGVVTCSCAWGCPCQFNASPTLGRCTGNGTWRITDGYYGETRLDELCFAIMASFPGPLHEGNGTAQWIIDERAGPQQREIFDSLFRGAAGGTFFEIFSSITPNKRRTIVSPIHLELDQNTRWANVRIPGLLECDVEPIRNPVTGEEHRARIQLPFGFEYREAEVANAVHWKGMSTAPFEFEETGKHAHLNYFDWSNA